MKNISEAVIAVGQCAFAFFCRAMMAAAFLLPIFGATAVAQVDATKEFREALFPPDLILREADALGLTDEQRDGVTPLVKAMKQTFADRQAKLREATENLGQSLKVPSIREEAALDRFAAVLEIEAEIKRAQFLMLLRAKNLLSPEQQEKLRVIVKNQPSKGPLRKQVAAGSGSTDIRQELNARMQQVQVEVERWRREGRDPAPILALMNTFADQMQAEQFPGAKETLQLALERLDLPKLAASSGGAEGKSKRPEVGDYPFWSVKKRGFVTQLAPGLNAVLQLTDAQKEQIAAARDEMSRDEAVKAARGISKNDPAVTAEQREKARAVFDAASARLREKVDAILTPEQSALIAKINSAYATAVEEIATVYEAKSGAVKNDEAARKRMQEEKNQDTEDQFLHKLDTLLTPAQKDAMTRAAEDEQRRNAAAPKKPSK